MRILVHDYAGHPFQVQLSRELAGRGHTVWHLFYGYNNTPKGDLVARPGDPKGFQVEPVFTRQPVQKYSYIKRWQQESEYGRALADRIAMLQPDVVLSANAPLDAQWKIYNRARWAGVGFVFWLQDVLGLAAYRLLRKKLPLFGHLVGKYQINLERKMLRQSDAVILIADEFEPIVTDWDVRAEKIHVIPNWAPLEDVPIKPKVNPWSIANGLENCIVFLYAGGLGLKHNPGLLLQLALHFRDRKDVKVVVIAQGPGADWLGEQKDKLDLNNLALMDYEPFDQMPCVLAAGDVLVAILEPEAGIFSVPSKVLTYLCAQRALLLAVPANNLAANIVRQNDAGLVVEPRDVNGFLQSAEQLYRNSAMRLQLGRNARIYAEKYFDIRSIGDSFESILLALSQPRNGLPA